MDRAVCHCRIVVSLLLILVALLSLCACQAVNEFENVLESVRSFGPYNVTSEMMLRRHVRMAAFPEIEENVEVGIVGLEFNLYDEQGISRGIDYVYVHQFAILQVDGSSLPCVEDWPLLGTGAELSNMELPYPFIYVINSTDQWLYLIDLMIMTPDEMYNPDEAEQSMGGNSTMPQISRYARLEMKIKYIELGENSNQYQPVKYVGASVTGCSASVDFNVTTSNTLPTSTFTWEFVSNFTGTIVWMVGHLHSGGKSIRLVQINNGQLKTVFNSVARYDDTTRMLVGMSVGTPMVHIVAGTKMLVEAIYEDEVFVEDAMGLMYGFVHLGAAEPTFPPPPPPSGKWGGLTIGLVFMVGVVIGIALALVVSAAGLVVILVKFGVISTSRLPFRRVERV